MLELNLLPNVKINYLKTQKLKHSIVSICIILSLVFVILFGGFMYYVYIFQKAEINNQNAKITSYIAQIKSNKDLNKILTVQNQLNSLPGIEATPVTTILLTLNPTYLLTKKLIDFSISDVRISTEPIKA